VDACNGLGMLVTFFALTTGVAIVLNRPLLDKLVIVASAVPIALLANIVRITVTGILYEKVGGEVAMMVYHGLVGWLMTPLALVLTMGELIIFSHLLVERLPEPPLELSSLGLSSATGTGPSAGGVPGL